MTAAIRRVKMPSNNTNNNHDADNNQPRRHLQPPSSSSTTTRPAATTTAANFTYLSTWSCHSPIYVGGPHFFPPKAENFALLTARGGNFFDLVPEKANFLKK